MKFLKPTALLIVGVCALSPTSQAGLLDEIRTRRQERRERFEALRTRRQGQATTSKTSADADREHFLTHDGRRRRYLVHVPHGYDGTTPLPVVLNFHGGMGRAESQRQQSQMNPVADRYGFIVVYPDGTGRNPDRMLTFNAGSCCSYAVKHQVDDVGFVRQLLDALPQQYAVDTKRVYATGFSNGAMLCYRLAAELSDRIAAIGPVSGDMGVDGPHPTRAVAVIHFHGLQDQNAPFDGGKGANQFQPEPHRPIPETIAWWVRANRCRPTPVEVKKAKDFIMERYEPEPGQAGAPVILYKLPDGGHQWPGGNPPASKFLNLGPLVESVDASRLMWEFFKDYSR